MTPREPGRGARLAASALGIGRLPFAPGTWGSLAGCAAFLPLRPHATACWAALAAVTALAVWSSGVAARALRRRDPGEVVLDEMAGMGLALAASPGGTWPWAAGAFVLFRMFDILKPPPLRALERLPGGFGIVADDLGAALYAAGALWGVRLLA